MNFQHLYMTKVIQVKRGNTVLFEATVGEIPHGKAAKLKAEMFKKVDMDMDSTSKKQIKNEVGKRVNNLIKEMDVTEFEDRQTLLGVYDWTLKDDNGNAVPVDYSVWIQLPEFVVDQITKGVDECNPELDDEFQGEPGSND